MSTQSEIELIRRTIADEERRRWAEIFRTEGTEVDALTVVRNICRKLAQLGDNELDYVISKAMEIRAERSKCKRAETPTVTA